MERSAYIYDAFGSLAAEYTNGTTWARDYIRWGGGQLVATENASGPCATCYFTYDHLGSTRLVTDGSANVVARHDYLPYGEEIASGVEGRSSQFGGTADTSVKFTGQVRDQEAGQDYFNARYFAAVLGRFHSPDPGSAGADVTDPQSWNAYAYVRNSPLQMVDPSGMADVNPGDPGDPEDPGPCGDFYCDPSPFPPGFGGGGGPVSSPQPSAPTVTSSSGGSPIPSGSFLGGESSGLPAGIGVPSVLQVLLGTGASTPCDFGVCNGLAPMGSLTVTPPSWLNIAIGGVIRVSFGVLGGLIFGATPTSTNDIYHGPPAGWNAKGGKQNIRPSWAEKYGFPLPNESGTQYADRLCKLEYGPSGCPGGVGPDTDYNRLKKWADRRRQ